MKRIFEEPKVSVEQFTVTDILTVSWAGGGDDETEGINPFNDAPIVPAS